MAYKIRIQAKKMLEDIEFAKDLESCLKDSDALVILTEWNEFRSLSPRKLLGVSLKAGSSSSKEPLLNTYVNVIINGFEAQV